MDCHAQLTDSLEDQLSLASIHYLRGHYQVTQPNIYTHTHIYTYIYTHRG